VVEAFDVTNVPLLRGWLGRAACHAYHQGFIDGLARDPRDAVLTVASGEHGEPAGRHEVAVAA
jgi:hypothetical protein